MEENNFERELQQKMKELLIEPSEGLWPKIEDKVGKKKSRKGLLVLLLLAGLLLGGGYYLLWYPGGRANSNRQLTGSSEPSQQPSDQRSISPEPPGGTPGTSSDEPASITPPKVLSIPPMHPTASAGTTTLNHRVPVPSGDKVPRLQLPGENKEKEPQAIPERQETMAPQSQQQQPLAQAEDAQPPVQKKGVISDTMVTASPKQINPAEKAIKKDAARGVKTAGSATASSSHKLRSWKPAILFSAGLSGVGRQLPSATYAPSASYSNAAGPGSFQSYGPFYLRPGFGFSAGILGERKLSELAGFSVGIVYRSLEYSGKTGKRNDTTGFYAASTQEQRYHNHFSYIDLPLAIQLRLGKQGPLPLIWEGGVTFSALIHSDALQLNQAGGYFYKSPSGFNSFQWGMQTSLSLHFLAGHEKSLLLGPFVYYSPAAFGHQDAYSGQHVLSWGLRTELLLGK